MYESLKRFLDAGTMPGTWTSGVVTMIPKTKAMQTPDSLRPIALQTTRQKWLTNIRRILVSHFAHTWNCTQLSGSCATILRVVMLVPGHQRG